MTQKPPFELLSTPSRIQHRVPRRTVSLHTAPQCPDTLSRLPPGRYSLVPGFSRHDNAAICHAQEPIHVPSMQSGGTLGPRPVTACPFAELVQAVGALSWWSQPADCHAIGSGLSVEGG